MKATIKCNGREKEVELTEEQAREFGFVVSKVWKPKQNQHYYYIDKFNEICRHFWTGTDFDKTFYEIGNCYKKANEAEFERDCQLYLTKYKRWLEEHNKPIDWANEEQDKWYAYYNYKNNEISFVFVCTCKAQGVLYATSAQIILDFIAEIGEENFKKYILRVKED